MQSNKIYENPDRNTNLHQIYTAGGVEREKHLKDRKPANMKKQKTYSTSGRYA